jgi:hypothetical protein
MVVQTTGTASDPIRGYPTDFNPGDGLRSRYVTVGSRVNKFGRPSAGERALGILCTGQSTLANWGAGLYTSSNAKSLQGNIYDGQVYPMQDPVFDADGTDSSPAAAIGDILLGGGYYDRVLVVNVAFGSTNSTQWASASGNLFQGFQCAYNFLVNNGYTDIRHIHQQGEADALVGTSQATMLANIRAIDTNKSRLGMYCPMYVSQTTFDYDWVVTDPDPDNWTPGSSASAIRAAQAASWNGDTILPGPDTDTLRGSPYRLGAHWMSQTGVIACANLWAETLRT